MSHEVKINKTYHGPVTLPYILHVLSAQAVLIIIVEIGINHIHLQLQELLCW